VEPHPTVTAGAALSATAVGVVMAVVIGVLAVVVGWFLVTMLRLAPGKSSFPHRRVPPRRDVHPLHPVARYRRGRDVPPRQDCLCGGNRKMDVGQPGRLNGAPPGPREIAAP
jgi:hypothetical protein